MILDYIWKSLFLISVSASIYLCVTLLASLLLRNASAVQAKWYLNSQILFLTLILGGSFIVAGVDSQMLNGCFEKFAKDATWTFTRWIAATWLGGFLLLALKDAVQSIVLAYRTSCFAKVSDPELIAVFKNMKAKLGVKQPVELLVTPSAHSPFAYGIFAHKIAVPLNLDIETLRSAFAHELIHVRDRDSLWLMLEQFCRRILFWNPLVYLLTMDYRLMVEKAADESAITGAEIAREEFLSALIRIASLSASAPASPLQLNASRGFRECKARIEFLMRSPRRFGAWRLPVTALTVLTPVAFSFAQTATVRREGVDPRMCMQVKHEKLIESWLRVEPAPPMKCGK